jgi:hypothetical protein
VAALCAVSSTSQDASLRRADRKSRVFLRQDTSGVNTNRTHKLGHLTAEWFGAQTLPEASIATACASFTTYIRRDLGWGESSYHLGN